jgi:hypothetical protein
MTSPSRCVDHRSDLIRFIRSENRSSLANRRSKNISTVGGSNPNASKPAANAISMGIPGHILTSVTVIGIVFGATHSISLSLGVASGSLLLDADHLLDYFFIDEQRSLNPIQFFKYYRKGFPLRRALVLHSYELLIILLIVSFLASNKALAGFAVGAFIHLAADILPRSNRSIRSRIQLYSFAYRWHHGFYSSRLYRQD